MLNPNDLQHNTFKKVLWILKEYTILCVEKTVWTHFAAGGVSSDVESSLYQRVHAMLRELDTHSQAVSACNKGT